MYWEASKSSLFNVYFWKEVKLLIKDYDVLGFNYFLVSEV